MGDGQAMTRRALLGGALALGLSSTAAARPAHRRRRRVASGPIPLPSPAQVRDEFTRMVEFGPRLTGSRSHERYIAWLEDELTRAGLRLEPCDSYQTDRWLAERWGLSVAGAGAIPVASYYPRSAPTAPEGVAGPLVYGGVAPALSISGSDLNALEDAIAGYPAQLASWAAGAAGTVQAGTRDSILLVDLPMPLSLTAAFLLPIATYLSWPGHSLSDWATDDYKRLWIEPGLGVPLTPFQAIGAKAVVFICDASQAALAGGYLPFGHGLEPIPALYVDRDTGEILRSLATKRPAACLTLTMDHRKVSTQAVTAVLAGESEETLIFNTHTDGQGFAEENGGPSFVMLARHFASLPARRRPRRTLVFAAWPGHMTYDLPQTQGWIDAHPDLVARAAAALTVEHLGCSEWVDSLDLGYHPTGDAEAFGVWTTQGPMFDYTRATVIKHKLPHTALLRPPVQFGVGGAFQTSGIPQIGAIAGPEYLVTVSKNGDLDKLDERLAARQIAWLADLATQLDGVSAATLRQGDATLGRGGSAPSATPHTEQACGPSPPSAQPTRDRKHRPAHRHHPAG
jgi:hypothetical protein